MKCRKEAQKGPKVRERREEEKGVLQSSDQHVFLSHRASSYSLKHSSYLYLLIEHSLLSNSFLLGLRIKVRVTAWLVACQFISRTSSMESYSHLREISNLIILVYILHRGDSLFCHLTHNHVTKPCSSLGSDTTNNYHLRRTNLRRGELSSS